MSPELQAAVSYVIQNDGLYVIKVPERPGAIIPLCVKDGLIWSMKLDEILDPERFCEGAQFTGPIFRFPE